MNKNSKEKTINFIKRFSRFLLAVLKKWVFWIFLLPNIVDLFTSYFKSFQIPYFLYFLIPLIGFLIACFLVYKDLLDKLPEETIPNTHIKISMVEGDEYSFSTGSPYDSLKAKLFIMQLEDKKEKEFHYENEVLSVEGKPQYWLPDLILRLNLRIENDGNIPIDILRILITYTVGDFSPLIFGLSSILNYSKEINYPLVLKPSQIELIQVVCELAPGDREVVTIAQIAASINKLKKTLPITLKVDTLNNLGTRKEYITPLNISFCPLVDVFTSQLQHYHQEDLLNLIYRSK